MPMLRDLHDSLLRVGDYLLRMGQPAAARPLAARAVGLARALQARPAAGAAAGGAAGAATGEASVAADPPPRVDPRAAEALLERIDAAEAAR